MYMIVFSETNDLSLLLGEPTKCELSNSQLQANPLVRFQPKCDSEGLYLTIQCLENLGVCWCVDSDGREQEGTRKNGKPDCSNGRGKCCSFILIFTGINRDACSLRPT